MRSTLLAAAVVAFTAVPLVPGEAPRDEARLTLRYEMLRLINHDRRLNALPGVELDAEASALADIYCRTQITNHTTGHFTTDGLSPYMRYSFAGGNDGVSENAAAWSASYAFGDRAVYDMLRRSQAAMMGEVAPHDGHRRTILDPYATHVGIGIAWEKGEFRIVQEFIRRYITWTRPLPRSAFADEPITGAGKPYDGFRIEAITVHHEQVPAAITARAANAITAYKLPEKRREYLPRLRSYVRLRDDGTMLFMREEYTDGRHGDFHVAEDGAFKFTVPLRDGPGIYTVVVWVSALDDASRRPIAASNISIRVDGPAYTYGTR